MQQISSYFYETFVQKFDFWVVIALVAQLSFSARLVVQWITSERAGQSEMGWWHSDGPRRMIVTR